MNIKAKIINALPENKFIAVDEDKNSYTAICSGSVRKVKIYVGDFVNLIKKEDTFLIKEILPRKNYFIRPAISNIDYMVLCISVDFPKPDFLLLDKQIIVCKKNNVTPIICITKMDLVNEENSFVIDMVKNVYEKIGIKVWYTSAKNEDIKENMEFEPLKSYSFSGNSGVGKSTIVSKLTNSIIETNSVAEKTNRGRHTTKYVKIYELENNAFIIDTPGFSSYDLIDVEKENLREYYPEFADNKCKYLDCKHINEEAGSVCDIKSKVNLGYIDKGRYERYTMLYNILKEKEEFKYKR